MFAATTLKRNSPLIDVYSVFIIINELRAFSERVETSIDSQVMNVEDIQSKQRGYVCRYDFQSDYDRWYTGGV